MTFDPFFLAIVLLAVAMVALSKSGLLAGLGVAGVPLLSLVMPVRDATGMLLPLLLLMDAVSVWSYRRDVDWKLFWLLIPGGLIGTALGWLFAAAVSDAVVLLIVAGITILFLFDTWVPWRQKLLNRQKSATPPKPSTPWGWFWSTVSGFVSFVVLAGGPPYQIYTLPLRLPPARLAGTTAWYFASINLAKIVPYAMLGQMSVGNLSLSAALALPAIAFTFGGIYLVRRISVRQYYIIAYALVLLVAIKLLWDGITRLGM